MATNSTTVQYCEYNLTSPRNRLLRLRLAMKLELSVVTHLGLLSRVEVCRFYMKRWMFKSWVFLTYVETEHLLVIWEIYFHNWSTHKLDKNFHGCGGGNIWSYIAFNELSVSFMPFYWYLFEFCIFTVKMKYFVYTNLF